MSWNHRVMRLGGAFAPYGEEWYAIHAVHYGEGGAVEGCTSDAIAPGGATLDELRRELQAMIAALDKPVLDYDGNAEGAERDEGLDYEPPACDDPNCDHLVCSWKRRAAEMYGLTVTPRIDDKEAE